MNLLPQSHSEFHSAEYWEKFFKKRGSKAFEWYGEYPELCGILHKYIKPKDTLLVVGCGNSVISENLYDVGYHNIVNIDISDVVIRQMTDKNQTKRPEMKYLKKDVKNMDFTDGEFSVVFDKGTLDALLVDESEAVMADIDAMFTEIGRVLKQGGRYIIITLLQDHILKKILSYFEEIGWPIRIHRIETDSADKDFHMPVFAVVLTKFKKMLNMKQIFEISTIEEKVQRLDDRDKIKSVLKEMQYYALIRQQISKRNVSKEQLSLCLYTDVSSSPRYTLYIVDSPKHLPKKFGIFIVPQGRETEWIYSTGKGREQLLDSAAYERLIVVTLHRDHTYTDLQAVQTELSTKVMELAPHTYKPGDQVPFLSEAQGVGKRNIKHKGQSKLSGEYIIEEVEDGGCTFRRLIFSVSPLIIQSECRLIQGPSKKKGKKKDNSSVDIGYLCCAHHKSMVAGLGFIPNLQTFKEGTLSVLLVGLGGGGLASFLHKYFKQIDLTTVDIDETMVSIATDWFGYVQDERNRAHIGDGIEVINKQVEMGVKRHVVMLDVDSKDMSLPMSCPPEPFVEEQFLHNIKKLLYNDGVFVLNVVCRDVEKQKEVQNRVARVFDRVIIKDLDEDVNQIIYGINRTSESENESKVDGAKIRTIVKDEETMKFLSSCVQSSCVSLTDQFEDMVIIDR